MKFAQLDQNKRIMKKLIFGILSVFMLLAGIAQNVNEVYVLEQVIIGEDTILFYALPELTIEASVDEKIFTSKREEKRYNKLRKDVEKVWPYAELAGELLNGYNKDLALIKTKDEKRAYTKKIEEELESEFSSDLIRLSMNQQVILIKLIDRQTGNTSYEILQDYRGYVSAFLWQGLARIFGHNLKNDYDGNGDEEMIEEIIAEIEREKIELSYLPSN